MAVSCAHCTLLDKKEILGRWTLDHPEPNRISLGQALPLTRMYYDMGDPFPRLHTRHGTDKGGRKGIGA